ncbi:MAG: toll/interleukin-1 receptor domain-containing protein [Cyclobacteriaceae bacterium]
MATIYISHRSGDRDQAKQLSEELTKFGHRVIYRAVAESPGLDWRLVSHKAMIAADIFVVLISERALKSHRVMGEIGAARMLYFESEHLLLFPVLLGNQQIPDVVSDLYVFRA